MKILVVLIALAALSATPTLATRWIAIWTEDDSWVGVADDGQMWQLVPGNPPDLVGTFGPGPWVDFGRKTSGYPHEYYALKPNGEIWVRQIFGAATLFRSLPSDREWCAIELCHEGGYPPFFALSCEGEIWSLADPPEHVDTFLIPPVPAAVTSWGRVKGVFR
jgi:hypothetical protein